MDVHRRIAQTAFFITDMNKSDIKYSKDRKDYRSAILGNSIFSAAVTAPDARSLPKYAFGEGKPSIDAEHFDNMNYDQIMDNFKNVTTSIDNATVQYKTGKISAHDLGVKVGESYHAIQDFYSHSNYIELYVQVVGKGKTDGLKMDDIPTLQEAMSMDMYKDFATALKSELKTGTYPGNGPDSHKKMNHDFGAGSTKGIFVREVWAKGGPDWNSIAAEKVATRATYNINAKVESEIK